jgi:anti-anti-sigma factor
LDSVQFFSFQAAFCFLVSSSHPAGKRHPHTNFTLFYTAAPSVPFMNVKIDTKERFRVIRLLDQQLPANMSEALKKFLAEQMSGEVPHIVLDMGAVEAIDVPVAATIARVQQDFYDANISFVICCMRENVEALFDEQEFLEAMNVTKTESEAWDIVQMEEIERELTGDLDEDPANT